MEHSFNVTGSASRRHVYPLKMETLPLNESITGSKDNNIIPSAIQDLPKESEIDVLQNRIITTITQDDLQTKSSRKRDQGDSKDNDNSKIAEENDESFRFKRHKNKSGVPTLVERLDSLQHGIPPKRMENFDSSFPIQQPSSQNNNNNNNSEISKTGNSIHNSIQSQVSSSFDKNNNQNKLNVPPLLPLNQNLEYPNQMYPMYYVPIPTSPINPQYYTSDYRKDNNSKSNDLNKNIQPIPAIPNAFFPYPPSSQPVIQPFPQFIPIPANMNELSKQSNSNKYSMLGNRGRRLSIVSNRENSIIMPHSDIPTKEYYRHLTDTNVSNKLKQLFTWCAIKTYQDFKQKDSNFMNRKFHNVSKDSNSVESTYLDTKRMTLNIINDFINDLQHGSLDIDWNAPSDPNYTVNKQQREIPLKSNSKIDDTNLELNEDPVLEELFDDDDNISEMSKNDPDNVTYYYDGLNLKKFKKKKPKKLAKELKSMKKDSNIQSRNKPLQKLLPNPKNAENEINLELLSTRIDKLKEEIDEWKKVIDEHHPDSEWQSITRFSEQGNVTNNVKENIEFKLVGDIEKLNNNVSNVGLELSERVNKLQAHSHLYKSYTKSLTQSIAYRIGVFVTEFKHNQKKRSIKSKSVKDFLLDLSKAKKK